MKEQKAGFFIKFGRILKWSLISFWRNRLLSIASILVIIITLLTVTLFGILNIAINKSVKTISEKMDFIAYINENAAEKDILNLKKNVENIDGVSSVSYITKKLAFEKWKSFQKDSTLVNIYSEQDNPFPRSLEVKMSNPEKISNLDSYFKTKTAKAVISKTSLGKSRDSIQKLITITKTLKKSGLIASIFFLLISILIVYNTIRLAIHSRKDEIEIMTLVGASPASIKWPFVVEALLYGIIATIISMLLIYGGFKYFSSSNIINSYLSAQYYAFFSIYWIKIALLELALGVLIGVVCSAVAVRNYIKI